MHVKPVSLTEEAFQAGGACAELYPKVKELCRIVFNSSSLNYREGSAAVQSSY